MTFSSDPKRLFMVENSLVESRLNEEILLSYAENPKVNQGWMSADSPWQFLAACIELKKLREWQYNEHVLNFK